MATGREDVQGALREALAGRSDVRLALLFGSHATGRAGEGSDVDVAVRAPGADLLQLASDLGAALEVEVDVVSLDAADIPLLMEIVEHGIVVHEGAPGEQARWRSAALTTLEIDGPWYVRMRDAWLRRVAAHGIRSW